MIPDIDILIPFLQHRGPTHSILSAIALFLPAFLIWRQKAVPYFAAFVQHSLIGDYLGGGGLQLLWPLTNATYGTRIDIRGSTNAIIEILAFLAAMIIMLKTKDMSKLFRPKKTNLILIVPVVTVLLPTLLAYPLSVPPVLAIPHVIYLAIFTISIIAYVRARGKVLLDIVTHANYRKPIDQSNKSMQSQQDANAAETTLRFSISESDWHQ